MKKLLDGSELGQFYFHVLIAEVRLMSEEEFSASSYFEMTQKPIRSYESIQKCFDREALEYSFKGKKYHKLWLLNIEESEEIITKCFKEAGLA